jgi:hypothetical protein
MRSLPILPSIDGVPDTRRVHMVAPQAVQHDTSPRSLSSHRRLRVVAGAAGISAAVLLMQAPSAFGQGTPPTPQDTRPPYNSIVGAPATLPDPVPPVTLPATVPATAAVAGVQITTAPTTVAPVVTVAAVVSVAPQASVLGSVEEQAEDVAFTGSESGRFTALGVAFTAVGAALIAVTRRRRRA